MPLELVELWCQGLRQGWSMRYGELSISMLPTIRTRDLVTVIPAKHCRLGDIILYRADNMLVLHRVVAKSAHRLIVKGDGVGYLDPPVAPQAIIGRATTRERQGTVRSLDTLGARFLGLAFSLTISWLPAVRRVWGLLTELGVKKPSPRHETRYETISS